MLLCTLITIFVNIIKTTITLYLIDNPNKRLMLKPHLLSKVWVRTMNQLLYSKNIYIYINSIYVQITIFIIMFNKLKIKINQDGKISLKYEFQQYVYICFTSTICKWLYILLRTFAFPLLPLFDCLMLVALLARTVLTAVAVDDASASYLRRTHGRQIKTRMKPRRNCLVVEWVI